MVPTSVVAPTLLLLVLVGLVVWSKARKAKPPATLAQKHTQLYADCDPNGCGSGERGKPHCKFYDDCHDFA